MSFQLFFFSLHYQTVLLISAISTEWKAASNTFTALGYSWTGKVIFFLIVFFASLLCVSYKALVGGIDKLLLCHYISDLS